MPLDSTTNSTQCTNKELEGPEALQPVHTELPLAAPKLFRVVERLQGRGGANLGEFPNGLGGLAGGLHRAGTARRGMKLPQLLLGLWSCERHKSFCHAINSANGAPILPLPLSARHHHKCCARSAEHVL